MMNTYLKSILVLVFFLSILCGCGRKTDEMSIRHTGTFSGEYDSLAILLEADPYNPELNRAVWDYMKSRKNLYALTESATGVLSESMASGNDQLASLAIVYILPAYTMLNEKDSVKKYLALSDSIAFSEPECSAQLDMAKANSAFKFDMDYARALDYYNRALKQFRLLGDTSNMIIVMDNVASLYYVRGDSSRCMQYVRKAEKIATESGDPYSLCLSGMYTAQMNYAHMYYEEALASADKAIAVAETYPDLDRFLSDLFITKGYVYKAMDSRKESLEAFDSAFRYADKSAQRDSSIYSRLYVAYGDYYCEGESYDTAKHYYREALKSSGAVRNEVKRAYQRLAGVYGITGPRDTAEIYTGLYKGIYDSIFNYSNEKEFGEISLGFEKERLKDDILESERKAARNRKAVIIFSVAFVLAVSVIAVMLVVSRRKDRRYTELVRQHQELLKKNERARSRQKDNQEKEDARSRAENELFLRVEALMKEEKVYRDKELSLEKLADMLDSNRTYVSNVINKYASASFSNYVNSYRIAEAIAIISDPSNGIPLKALYDDLGYNSKSSFYRAFQKETGCSPMVYRNKILEMNGKEPE